MDFLREINIQNCRSNTFSLREYYFLVFSQAEFLCNLIIAIFSLAGIIFCLLGS